MQPPAAAPQSAASSAPPQTSARPGNKGSSRTSTGPEVSQPAKQPFVKPLAANLSRLPSGPPVSSQQQQQQGAGSSNGGGRGGAAAAPVSSDDDVPDPLQLTHMDLCSTIRDEEEAIVEAHRAQIDSTMRGVKEEMELLKRFDTAGTGVDEYVDRLDEMLSKKIQAIQELKNKLKIFKKHLKQEEGLWSGWQGCARVRACSGERGLCA